MVNINSICSGLQRGKDGIWYATKQTEISYPPEGNKNCFALEDNFFWFQHRNKCIIALIQTYPPEHNGPIFDIGGGNGYVSHGIAQSGFDVVLVEPGIDGIRNARTRGIKQLICASLQDAQFFPKTLHAVGLFDVVEHIKDDLSFLRSINSLLVAGGKIYITVPAYSFLWSNEDVFAGHYRRYTIKTLSEKLKQAGFHVDFSTYIFRFLPLPIFLLRTIPSRFGLVIKNNKITNVIRDRAVKNSTPRRALDAVLSIEIRNIRRKLPMHFGGSCLLVATSS